MFTKIITLVFLSQDLVNCNYLEAEANYQKPKLERNNIVNKGVWVRNKLKENFVEKDKVGDFIFRENSLDVDNLLQNNFDAFGTNYMQDTPLAFSYIKRTKRAAGYNGPRTSIIKNCNGKKCNHDLQSQAPPPLDPIKNKILNALRPTSVFNDYPYEVAVLLNSSNNKSEINEPINDTELSENDIEKVNANYIKNPDVSQEPGILPVFRDVRDNDTIHKNITSPKRSMKYDFETEIIKKIEYTEDINKTEEIGEYNDSKIMDRNIFDKDNTVWHQNAPIPDVNVYKVVPKEPQKSKPVTERGLIKVISMLTKTFKKIMKQHNEIKDIHSRINDINDEFVKNAATLTNKIQDFDVKYLNLVKFHEKLKVFEVKLASKQAYFKNKETEMARNFKEFENQQKKFLQQQRQFYNIQKLMLAQNEKINIKQNLIAKTQSEISHRQNNFARILKKAKQLYVESRNPSITKLSSSITKANHQPKSDAKVTYTSTASPASESVKINLFSIPTSNKILNQDDSIIKEKDEQNIDDLVYKYYFNNTFIDNLMKNNVLNSFMSASETFGNSHNVKNKRHELQTTILLPIYESLNENDSEALINKNRERRWINHHSRHKSKRRERGKGGLASVINATDAKFLRKRTNNIPVESNPTPKDAVEDVLLKSDPFLTMATNFCTEIRQDKNPQMLRWCVEKALRRLQFIDMNSLPTTEVTKTTPSLIPLNTKLLPMSTRHAAYKFPDTVTTKAKPTTSSPKVVTQSTAAPSQPSTTAQSDDVSSVSPQASTASPMHDSTKFFPDNEELESNLKQYELKPDTEGNVYFEGSVHASELLDSDSQGVDDIMPGLDSNSRLEKMPPSPLSFDIRASRAFVTKLNERIKKSLG